MVNKLEFNTLAELVDKDKITCEQLKDIQDNLDKDKYKLCIEVGASIFEKSTLWSTINSLKNNGPDFIKKFCSLKYIFIDIKDCDLILPGTKIVYQPTSQDFNSRQYTSYNITESKNSRDNKFYILQPNNFNEPQDILQKYPIIVIENAPIPNSGHISFETFGIEIGEPFDQTQKEKINKILESIMNIRFNFEKIILNIPNNELTRRKVPQILKELFVIYRKLDSSFIEIVQKSIMSKKAVNANANIIDFVLKIYNFIQEKMEVKTLPLFDETTYLSYLNTGGLSETYQLKDKGFYELILAQTGGGFIEEQTEYPQFILKFDQPNQDTTKYIKIPPSLNELPIIFVPVEIIMKELKKTIQYK